MTTRLYTRIDDDEQLLDDIRNSLNTADTLSSLDLGSLQAVSLDYTDVSGNAEADMDHAMAGEGYAPIGTVTNALVGTHHLGKFTTVAAPNVVADGDRGFDSTLGAAVVGIGTDWLRVIAEDASGVVALTGNLTVGGTTEFGDDVDINGNLNVVGTTTSIDTAIMQVAARYGYLNNGYTAVTALTGGSYVNIAGSSTVDTVATGGFTAGVAGVSNPTVITTGSATLATNDIIQISDANEAANSGVYEVLSHVLTTLTVRGIGLTSRVEDFPNNQFVTDTTVAGGITKVTVAVMRAGTDGQWEQGTGSETGIVYVKVPDNTGDIIIGGTLDVTGDLTVDTNTLFVDASTNKVGIRTLDPKINLHIVTGGVSGLGTVPLNRGMAITASEQGSSRFYWENTSNVTNQKVGVNTYSTDGWTWSFMNDSASGSSPIGSSLSISASTGLVTAQHDLQVDGAADIVGNVTASDYLIGLRSIVETGSPTAYGISSENLIGYWTGNGNAKDYSGYGNDCTLAGTASYTNGVFGSCFSFDGSGYAEDGSTTDLDVGTGAWSASAWIKLTDGSQTTQRIVGKQDGPGSYAGWDFRFNQLGNGALYFLLLDSNTVQKRVVGTQALQDDIWYHVSFTYDGVNAAGMQFYIDGVADTMVVVNDDTITTATSTQSLSIGGSSISTTLAFFGSIDDVMIFDRELSSDDISSLYAAGNTFHPVDGVLRYENDVAIGGALGVAGSLAVGTDFTVGGDIESSTYGTPYGGYGRAQNYLQLSESMGVTTIWHDSLAYTTVTTNNATAPNGEATADTVEWTTLGRGLRQDTLGLVTSSTYTISFWARAVTQSTQTLTLELGSGTSGDVAITNTAMKRYSITLVCGVDDWMDLIYNGTLNDSFEMWGWQINDGSSAYPYLKTVLAVFTATTDYGSIANGNMIIDSTGVISIGDTEIGEGWFNNTSATAGDTTIAVNNGNTLYLDAQDPGGTVYLYADTGFITLDTGGGTITLKDATTISADLTLNGDTFVAVNKKIAFGAAGGEFELYYNGTDSHIDSLTGDLTIDNQDVAGDINVQLGANSDATSFRVKSDAGGDKLVVSAKGDVAVSLGSATEEFKFEVASPSGNPVLTADGIGNTNTRNLATPFGGLGRRQNLLKDSENFIAATTAWSNSSGATISSNDATAPNGETTADTLTRGTSTLVMRQGVDLVDSAPYTFSFWARSTSGTKTFGCDLGDGGGSNEVVVDGYMKRYFIPITSAGTSNWIDINMTTVGDIEIWGLQLNEGLVAYPYTKTGSTAHTDDDYGAVVNGSLLVDESLALTQATDYNQTTGWLYGGEVTVNGVDNTLIDISAGKIRIVSYQDATLRIPVFTDIEFTAQTSLDPGIFGRSIWVGVQDDGAGAAQFAYSVGLTPAFLRVTGVLCRLLSNTGDGQISSVLDFERPAWGLTNALQDFILQYGSYTVAGNAFTPNNSNLLLDRGKDTTNTTWRYNTSDTQGEENVHSETEALGLTAYNYHLEGLDVTTLKTAIDPTVWDNLTQSFQTVPTGHWTIPEIWYFPSSGTTHVVPGQATYESKPAALIGLDTEMKIRNTEILDGAIFRTYLIVQEGSTDLSEAVIIQEPIAGLPSKGQGRVQQTDKIPFAISDSGTLDEWYAVGFYDSWPTTSVTLNTLGTTTQVLGTASEAKGAHVGVVFNGGGNANLVLTVTGTSFTEEGVLTPGDSEVLYSGIVLTDVYAETTKFWVGQVTLTISTVGTDGTYQFNYGWAAYEDLDNRDFTITGVRLEGLVGATAADLNVEVIPHITTGWTYAATAFKPGSTALVSLATDYGSNTGMVNGAYVRWKRANLSTDILGASGEQGVVVRFTQTTNNAFDFANGYISVLV